MRSYLSAGVAIVTGVIILIGYFLHLPILDNLRTLLLEWATILASVALLVGLTNLFSVHWGRLVELKTRSLYSGLLLISLVVTLGVVGWFGPAHTYSLWILNSIQIPVEVSLMALLAVILLIAAIRAIQRRSSMMTLLFISTAIIVLLATGPLFGISVPCLSELRTWIAQVPAMAGARGLLLGIGLGIVATGLRVLLGSDRPYGA